MRLAPHIIIAALLLNAAPAWANGVHDCSTPLQNADSCEAGDTLLVWDGPSAAITELAQELQQADVDLYLVALAAPAIDRRTTCTAGAVTLGICRDAIDQEVISVAWASGIVASLADVIRPDRWDTVRCSLGSIVLYPGTGTQWSNPVIEDASLVCQPEQVGQQVPNPLTAEEWAWRWIRDSWRDIIVRSRVDAATSAAEAATSTAVDMGEE